MAHITHYHSIADLLAASDKPLKLAKNRQLWEDKRIERRRSDWYGIDGTAADCQQVIVNGWPVAIDRMTALSAQLSANLPQAEGVARKTVRSDSRGRLDIHAVNSGRLSVAWVSKKRTVTRAPLPVQIIVDVCDHCGVNADVLAWRGVAAMTLSQMLQKAGYLVGIQAAIPTQLHSDSSRRGPEVLILVDVKPVGQRLDMATLSSTVGFPGFFRTFGFFALIAAGDALRFSVVKAVGHKIDATQLIEPSMQITQMLVPSKVENERTAREWLEECVNLLGGKS